MRHSLEFVMSKIREKTRFFFSFFVTLETNLGYISAH